MAEGKTKKAGIVIYGTNRAGKRAFVMPYSEGRFGYGDKYYVLPKGSLDKNEEVRRGAWRETEEETGIDLTKLLGEPAKEAFFKGEEIAVPCDSPGYPGVRIAHVGLIPVSHAYIARSGVKRPTELFGIEVENIELLAPHLKNAPNAGTNHFNVRESIYNFTHNANKCPQFDDFLMWLNTGEMPRRAWNEGKPAPAPLYSTSIKKPSPFERIAIKTIGKPVKTRAQWKLLFRDMDAADYKEMQSYCASIKETVGALGITNGDSDIIKLDDKDTPLQFFQEGADIIAAEDYLTHCYRLLRTNPDYALSFGGAGSSTDFKSKPRIHIRKSQVVAVAPFIPPAEMKQALEANNLQHLHWHKHLTPLSESGVKPFFEFHPAFSAIQNQPDYWTSRATQANEEGKDTIAAKG